MICLNCPGSGHILGNKQLRKWRCLRVCHQKFRCTTWEQFCAEERKKGWALSSLFQRKRCLWRTFALRFIAQLSCKGFLRHWACVLEFVGHLFLKVAQGFRNTCEHNKMQERCFYCCCWAMGPFGLLLSKIFLFRSPNCNVASWYKAFTPFVHRQLQDVIQHLRKHVQVEWSEEFQSSSTALKMCCVWKK